MGEKIDTMLRCLVWMAGLHQIAVEEKQLERAYVTGTAGMDLLTLLRASREIGLQACAFTDEKERLSALPMPFMAQLLNGNQIIVLKQQAEEILLLDPYRAQPMVLGKKRFLEIWTGAVILFRKAAQPASQGHVFNLFWFIPILLKYKKCLCQVLVLSFFLQLLGLISPLFTQVIIDKVLVHRSLSTLDVLVAGMFLVALFQVGMTSLRSYLFTYTTNKMDVILSARLFQHITALPMAYFASWKVGDIVTRVRELDTIRQFLTGSAFTVLLDTVFAVVYMVVMFHYSTTLGIFVLFILPIYTLLNLVITPIYRHLLGKNFEANADNQAFLIEAVTGIETVKALAVEPYLAQRWEQRLAAFIKTSFAVTNLANAAGNLGNLIQQLFNLLILWYGAGMVMQNDLSVGELIAFQMIAGMVIAPVLRLVNLWQSFQQTQVSLNKLGDIMNAEAEPDFDPTRTTLPGLTGNIVFERVNFRYRADMPEVLYQLSLQIRAGQRIGIVGRSGSGKSTLTKLIQRLYVPESGRILMDGVDIAQVEPAWLRRQIGVVLQDNVLFNGTIAENIALAVPKATKQEIVAAAEISGASAFIELLPKKYESLVGERGNALSGGQRQRIAIARALLMQPKILILDEATSALDYESERIIMDNMKQIAAHRTVLMIAHRLTTVCSCDEILYIEHGQVAERGSHDELLARHGRYYDLWQQQATENGLPVLA